MKTEKQIALSLPCFRGRMGDWLYYAALLSLKEINNRVFQPREIDERYEATDIPLGEWIQREPDPKRLSIIAEYLVNQEQRFFNSLVLGIYGGQPSWQEISFSQNRINEPLDEDAFVYFAKTFGILTLSGNEDIFAIDGQHRVLGIREAIKRNPELGEDEVSVIFIAHKTDEEGKTRTRRLFSTLNKYAKPVNESEIIALSEDNNCAIITRYFIENYTPLAKKIIINKNRSINPDNSVAFTNILLLHDFIVKMLTDKSICGIKVKGRNYKKYIQNRESEDVINLDIQKVFNHMDTLIKTIPSLNSFIESGTVNRKDPNCNLIFRPIGQNVLFNVLKVAEDYLLLDKALEYFSRDDFNLSHRVWKEVFWDDEIKNINPEKSRQKYATLLILEKIGYNVHRTKKDLQVYQNYKFSANDL